VTLQRHRQLRLRGVGTGKTVTSSNLALGGAAASNYALSTTSATTTANITAATLTPAITAANKIYDGTSTRRSACTLTGVVGGDVVTCSGTGSFDSPPSAAARRSRDNGLSLSARRPATTRCRPRRRRRPRTSRRRR
jgi:hypothetical protein